LWTEISKYLFCRIKNFVNKGSLKQASVLRDNSLTLFILYQCVLLG
jgi:hypothetical protein